MPRWLGHVVTAVAGAASLLVGAGCGSDSAPALAPEAFVHRRPIGEYGAEAPVDRTGPQYEGRQQQPAEPIRQTGAPTPIQQSPVAQSDDASSRTSANSLPLPGDVNTKPLRGRLPFPATAPSTQPTGVSTSEYQIVGTVLATVNGQPIFADKVLARIDRPLTAMARQATTPEQFRVMAANEAQRELQVLIDDEVEFAAAEKFLKKEDQELAAHLTTAWVNGQIVQANGSEALARQRVAQQGLDFDEVKKERFREYMVMIYQERRLKPLIHVTAQEMRRFYQENIRHYTLATAAKFRVIRINKGADAKAAYDKASDIYRRAVAGADFAELAGTSNDDPFLKTSRGALGENGWMEKGSYAQEKVENEVWSLPPGQITPPVDVGDAYYIAKLEELRVGQTKAFDDPKVQEQIFRILWDQQFKELRQKNIAQLLKDSVFTENSHIEETMMAMIMQKYAQARAASAP